MNSQLIEVVLQYIFTSFLTTCFLCRCLEFRNRIMQFGLMHCGGGLLVVLVYLASAPLSCAIHTYRPSQAARPKTNGQQEEHVLPAHTPENASNSTASPDPVPAKPSIVQPQPAGKPAAPDTARKPLTRPPTTPAPTTSNHSRGTHNNFTYWGTNGTLV